VTPKGSAEPRRAGSAGDKLERFRSPNRRTNDHDAPMRTSLGWIGVLILGGAAPIATAMAQEQAACRQIRAACLDAGFVQGAARDGIGLQIHCIGPIMQARTQPPSARRPLPKVDPQLVADCNARNARFGQPPVSPSAALPPPLPASPAPSGPASPHGTARPASGGRGDAAPYPGQDTALRPPMPMAEQRAVISALPPEDQPETGPTKSLPPQFRRTMIDYQSKEPAGTIIIDTAHTYLYLVLGNGKAMRYGIGVGRDGFTWSGTEKVTKMAEWPDWHPPEEMIERQPYLPRFMAGGDGNPLGARALYLGQTLYRIHGTNQPSTIGTFVSSGCIRLTNDDVTDLYGRVQVGTRVVVLKATPPDSVRATKTGRSTESAPPPRQRPKAPTAEKPAPVAEKPAATPAPNGPPRASSPQAAPAQAAPAQAPIAKAEAPNRDTTSAIPAPPAELWAE
jgi:lipoprotein-anchoring transpeptidase ErfK/SrfK